MAGYQLALDYRTQYTSTSITVANIDLVTNSGILVLQHLARVTNNLDIGAEFLYQANPMMPGGHIGITSFATRYRGMINIENLNFEKNLIIFSSRLVCRC